MASQWHSAALHPLKTVVLTIAGGGLASATLRATLQAALVAAPYSMSAFDANALLSRVKHADLLVNSGTLYMSDAGQVATATESMPYATGEKREIRNCKELLNLATVFSAAAADLRLELYS